MPQMFPTNWLLLPLLFTYTVMAIYLKSYKMFLQPIPNYLTNISTIKKTEYDNKSL